MALPLVGVPSDEEYEQRIRLVAENSSDECTPLNITTTDYSNGNNDAADECYSNHSIVQDQTVRSCTSADSEEEGASMQSLGGAYRYQHGRASSNFKQSRGGVGFLGSVSIAMNTLTGPAMLQLPATFQRSGIIPTCATIVFMSVLCNLCALSFANTISKVPGNLGFSKEIEYSEAFRVFWGRSWYIFTQIAFSMCIMCQLLASIVDVAQVVDTYVGSVTFANATSIQLIHGSLEVVQWDLNTACSNTAQDEDAVICVAFNRPSDSNLIISGGYLFCALIFLPMGLLELKENVLAQIVGFFALLIFSIQFIVSFLSSGLDTSNVTLWGSTWKCLFGVILFNFSVVTAVPAWLYEKRPSVSVPAVMNVSSFGAASLYVSVGLLGALSMPRVNDNMLSSMIAGASGPTLQIGASLFAFFIIGLGIPLFSVILRLNLTGSGLCSHRIGNLIAVWLPWALSWTLYQGAAIKTLLAWGGVLCTSIVVFIAPLLLELHAVYVNKNKGSVAVLGGILKSRKAEIRFLWGLLIVTILSVLLAVLGLAMTAGKVEEKVDIHYSIDEPYE